MISPDLPIKKSSEDRLNRASFAKSLAATVLQCSFPAAFTIGLYGAWGSGKTSLVNMVLETIEERDSGAVVLRFNPWLCSDPKQLTSQFFKQMSSAIKLKKSTSEKVWKLIDQYADIFEAANLIPGIGSILAAVGKAAGDEAKRQVEKRSGNLQSSKEQIISKLREEQIKLIVSIDDIDRLSEEEIIAVFQLVKALADFPNTVYILAFDYDVVVRALGEVQHGNGKDYLEKIIQMPFEIPAPNMTSIHEALFSKLQGILENIPVERWDKASWAELYQYGLRHYVRSIRDVNRYANVFSMKYQLLKDETDAVDLLGLVALQVFEPSVYSKLAGYKEILCGSSQGYLYAHQEENKKRIESTISLILSRDGTVANMEAARNILGILFPGIKNELGVSRSIGRYYSARDFLIHNNISASECFDRYFALHLEDSAIPTERVRDLMCTASEDELSESVMQIYREGRIVRLLDEIEAHASNETASTISADRAPLIISALARNWSSFEVDDSGLLLAYPFNWRLLNCTDFLLKRIDIQTRCAFTISLFGDKSVQPSTLALLLQDFEKQCGRFTEKAVNKDEAVIPEENVVALEEIFRQRVLAAVESGVVLKQRNDLDFLWMLEQIDPELAAGIKKTLVVDDQTLARVISYCTSRGTTVARIAYKTRSVNRKKLGEFIDVDKACQRVKAFVGTERFFTLPKDDQMNAIVFMRSMEQPASDPNCEKEIAEDGVLEELNQIRGQIEESC